MEDRKCTENIFKVQTYYSAVDAQWYTVLTGALSPPKII